MTQQFNIYPTGICPTCGLPVIRAGVANSMESVTLDGGAHPQGDYVMVQPGTAAPLAAVPQAPAGMARFRRHEVSCRAVAADLRRRQENVKRRRA